MAERVKPLVVGQAPSAQSDPNNPLAGACGRRLAWLCGLEMDEWLDAYQRVNLVRHFPGKLAKGDAWPAAARREAAFAAGMVHFALEGQTRPVVLLGGNVFDAFKVAWGWRPGWGKPTIGPYNVEGRQYRVCPHPSGVNRWWNDPFSVGQARSFWLRIERERAPDVPSPGAALDPAERARRGTS